MRRDLQNVTAYAAGESLWGLQSYAVSSVTFLPLLLKNYGAGNTEIGVQSALEVMTGLTSIIGLYLLYSRRRLKRQLMLWHVLVAIPFLVVAGVVNLNCLKVPLALRRWGLIACWTGHMWSVFAVITVWTDWASNLFETRIRGRAFAIALEGMCLAGMVGTVSVGWLLARYPGDTDVFSYVYFAAALVAGLSILTYSLWVRDDKADLAEEFPRPPKFAQIYLKFRQSLAEPNFRRFLVGRILAGAGLGAIQLVPAYYRSQAGGMLSDSSILIYAMALPLSEAVGALALGAMGDHNGHRLGVIVGTAFQVATVGVLLFSGGAVSCILAYAGMGVVFGGTWVSHINVVIESCPHEHRAAHITVSSLVLALPAALAAVAYGWMAEVFGFRVVFAIWLVFSMAALVWLVLRVKEPRMLSIYRSQRGRMMAGIISPEISADRRGRFS